MELSLSTDLPQLLEIPRRLLCMNKLASIEFVCLNMRLFSCSHVQTGLKICFLTLVIDLESQKYILGFKI
jgi:hypothetical protein